MAAYRLIVKCDLCGKTHTLPFAVSLDYVPPDKKSIAEIFGGKKIPDDIVSIKSNQVLCPKKEEYFTQKDDAKVFLTRV
jgi:hypothetical protein